MERRRATRPSRGGFQIPVAFKVTGAGRSLRKRRSLVRSRVTWGRSRVHQPHNATEIATCRLSQLAERLIGRVGQGSSRIDNRSLTASPGSFFLRTTSMTGLNGQDGFRHVMYDPLYIIDPVLDPTCFSLAADKQREYHRSCSEHSHRPLPISDAERVVIRCARNPDNCKNCREFGLLRQSMPPTGQETG